MMRKIKLTRANKSILLKALAPYYYREKALGHSTEKPGRLILKINALPADKKATFSTEEICLRIETERTEADANEKEVIYPKPFHHAFYAVCTSHGTFCGTYSPYAK